METFPASCDSRESLTCFHPTLSSLQSQITLCVCVCGVRARVRACLCVQDYNPQLASLITGCLVSLD